MGLTVKSGTLLLIFVASFSQASFRDDQNQSYFTPRSQTECPNSDPEFTSWFMQETREVPRVHKILGEVRDQGNASQCYALAAADMITMQTGVRVSGNQIIHLYYQNSTIGSLQKFIGLNNRGFIASAINSIANQAICAEPKSGEQIRDPDFRNTQVQFCEKPAFVGKKFQLSGNISTRLNAGHELFNKMDQILNNRKIVGISYQSFEVYLDAQKMAFNNFADHANTIVARQWNKLTRTCDYVIRNTQGEICMRSTGLCFRGYYSIPEQSIDRALQKIDYFNE